MTTTFYKAVRADGMDLYSGTINYADALGGDPVTLPVQDNPQCNTPAVLHAATSLSGVCSIAWWPGRLFEVTGTPVAQYRDVRGFFELSVVRELEPHTMFGLQGKEIAALIDCAMTLSESEKERLNDAWYTVDSLESGNFTLNPAWDDALDASHFTSARYHCEDALIAAQDFVANAVENINGYSNAWRIGKGAAGALAIRHLIGQRDFLQEHYDILTHPWREIVGSIHADDDDSSF